MTPTAAVAFRWLSSEALREAARRRIVMVIVALSLLSLAVIDGCSSCASGSFSVNDQSVDPSAVSAVIGVVMLGALCLWAVVLAGVLAADQLARSVSDGSVWMWLSRPLSRETFVLAQLTGALGIAWAAAGVLVASAAGLLAVRQGLPPQPAAAAGACALLNTVTVGSLAMAASLWLPRAAIALLVVGFAGPVAGLEGLALAGVDLEGLPRLVAEFGPPLLSAPLSQLSSWLPALEGGGAATFVRGTLWATGSVVLLLAVFRRVELRD